MKIELRGNASSFLKLVTEIRDANKYIRRDPGHPLANLIADIEEQVYAVGPHDFIDLDELFSE